MSACARSSPISLLLDTLADLLSPPSLHSLTEVGIFQASAPPTLTALAAYRHEPPNLGLASWSLSLLYADAKCRLLAAPTDLRAATVLLLACPDYATAWNARKEALRDDGVRDELQFCALLLMRSPKSAETWAHRSWVLRIWEGKERAGSVGAGEGVDDELELAWVAASRAKNNYYAGVHRKKVIGGASAERVEGELRRSRKWLRSHVSDSSGWWYQRLLVERLTELGIASENDEKDYARGMVERYRETYQCVRVHWKWVTSLHKAHIYTERGDCT